MYVPTSPPAPSPQAQTLAQHLAALVRERRAGDPTLRPADVEQAFALAREQLGSEPGGAAGPSRAMQLVLGVVAAALALAVGLFSVQP